jgi:KaiC/GvpD/RAD55 family RecA-like ATPase
MAKQVPRKSRSGVVPSEAYQAMERSLIGGQEEQKIFVLCGLPGSGKTHLVSHFVEQHRLK